MPTVEKQTPRKKRTVKETSKKVLKKRTASGITSMHKADGFESAWPGDDGIKINIYGRSKTGKTTLWVTFPGPILARICPRGRRPGEMRSIDTPEYRKKINPVILRHVDDLPKILERAGEYRTVVQDHGTSLQDLTIMKILGLDSIPLSLARQAGKGESWSLVSQQQYGQVAIMMKGMFRSLLDLPQNIVIVAQEREFNTDNESDLIMPFVASALTPSVVGWLNPAVDYICQTFIRGKTEDKKVKIAGRTTIQRKRVSGVEYCLRVGPHDVFTTGFRVTKGTKLPECIVDPTFDKINKLIQGC